MNMASGIAPEDTGLSSKRLKLIENWADALVASKKLAGLTTVVARRGKIAHHHTTGLADISRGTKMTPETIFRIYSMTKPLTSVAIMMLYEEGRFQLDDPISKVAPMFKNPRVAAGGMRGKIDTVPANREITYRDLLTHTSGITYGFMEANTVDAVYRKVGIDFQTAKVSLEEMCARLAGIPLIAQPGAEWNYSNATDVLGYLVQVISGQRFDDFLAERIIKPLGMVDTAFYVPQDKLSRFAANYNVEADGSLKMIDDPQKSSFAVKRDIVSGGGGLCSTASDYMRFCQMMLNKGELDGVRLLGRKTVELMTANHLRGDMADMGQPRFSESSYEGIGFGLGFSVMLDPAKAQILGTPGEYAWGGAASTAFWVDPAEEMIVLLMTQAMPSSAYPIRRELRVLSYQAVID